MQLILNKKNKNIFNTIFLFFILSNIALSQNKEIGSPYIINIPPKIYGFESQNYSIAQDKDGIIYFGNLSGILEFDGTNWALTKINGVPKLAANNKGVVFVGGFDDFGYLSKNDASITCFNSLINFFPKDAQKPGTITKVLCVNDFVLFCSEKNLYKWDGKTIDLLQSCNSGISAFKVNDELFVFKNGYGLLKYTGDFLKLLPNGNYFSNKKIIDIIRFKNKLLIKIEGIKNFILYDYNKLEEYIPEYSEFINNNDYVKGINLRNGNFAFATKKNGIIIIDKNSNYICSINKDIGLINNNINDIFEGRDNNLWIALNNGLAKVDYPSQYSIYKESSGVLGEVFSIIRFNNILYASTTQGIYYLNSNSNKKSYSELSKQFYELSGISGQCYNFYILKNYLFVTTEKGIYQINGNSAQKLTGGQLKSMHLLKDSTTILAAMQDGIHIFKLEAKNLIELSKINNFDKYLRTMAEDDDGNIWMGSDYDGIYKMRIKLNNLNNIEISKIDDKFGLPKDYDWIDVYKTSKGVLFSTSKGIYKYNKQKSIFVKDSLFYDDENSNNEWIYPIIEDKNKNIWFSSGVAGRFEKNTGYYKYNNELKNYIKITKGFKKISDFTIETIYNDHDSIVWFGGFDGIIRYDMKRLSTDSIKFITFINKLTIGKDSVFNLYSFKNEDSISVKYYNDTVIHEFKHLYNSLRFEFSAPSYNINNKSQYQYFLEGFDKSWSDWSETNFKEYTNLWEGKYTFFVRAKDVNDRISIASEFQFYVLSPIYRRWWAYVIYALISGAFILMIIKWRNYLFEKEKNKLDKIINERTEELVIQKERAEQLVSNILPRQTAEELKSVGRVSRKKYKMVTVLFSDIQEFTKIAEDMSPDRLLDELDKYFLHFDMVVEQYNIEKIKTIGDAYMCAGGLPQKNRTNPIEVVLAAIEMRQYMQDLQNKKENVWNVRIGIHTGGVIAGVVGSKKFSYDIWGDTVNIASRMESLGKPGEINISETTYDIVKDYFDCVPRGKVPAKYKGELNMYFVRGLKKDFSKNGDGITPNEKFFTKLQMVRFDDIDELIMTKLERGLPKTLYYHDLKHTIDVCTQVEILGRMEKVSEEELLLLKTAALFHDSGFLIGYDDHEFLAIKMAKETLPKFNYTESQIKVISDLIFATRLPPNPKNLLEQIMCDADLDYLGRPDFIPVSQKLFRELFERNKIKSVEEWNKMQIKFIENHQYFTATARQLRSQNKQEQLKKLKDLMNM